MTTARGVLLVASLLATTALTVALGVTDAQAPMSYPTRFLVWNLFLAWIPMLCALGFATVRARGALVPLGVGWLAFLPNSPYLVTDLVHLGEGANMWRHVLQYGFAAWTGILLGVVSLLLVHRRLEREFGARWGWLAVAVSVGLCAIGVVIGRFQRWNSWDLVTRPDDVVAATLGWIGSPFSHVESTGVALAVAAFYGLAYLTVWSLTPAVISPVPRPEDSADTPRTRI
ncbi:hypothetical protein TPAU25S_03576 [Tsukamurella paurometabola]|uniref:DUF1361 domain-containing protein n=1 Tax=Tsukamurella paurometabola (strain ATCC 8368 / DSM 20162 / CCUG 35730 / CIP 100753 / JCM 10117 / KCTC 9821 / NBRC 16120 / NCIMB 702349 / NCTC 13040) TaxID=521096 RepID=D5UPU2_TSUPD|nr:DUF1361 domain-containing protein [Tsukamurella paurometabola]ADG76710.1 protein of unknown function DUF1361 [Tsukamurella paurometabola DSM 20162]SUP41314.1 Predicted membrane protein [Tsukamurella paurometabola]